MVDVGLVGADKGALFTMFVIILALRYINNESKRKHIECVRAPVC